MPDRRTMRDDLFIYHSKRLTQELEQAEQARGSSAAAAHYKLAELHFDRLSTVAEEPVMWPPTDQTH